MSNPITADGSMIVYHRLTAGRPDLHRDGDWYYQPVGEGAGEVYSPGYATADEALAAAERWVQEERIADALATAEQQIVDEQ